MCRCRACSYIILYNRKDEKKKQEKETQQLLHKTRRLRLSLLYVYALYTHPTLVYARLILGETRANLKGMNAAAAARVVRVHIKA